MTDGFITDKGARAKKKKTHTLDGLPVLLPHRGSIFKDIEKTMKRQLPVSKVEGLKVDTARLCKAKSPFLLSNASKVLTWVPATIIKGMLGTNERACLMVNVREVPLV